MDIKGIKILQEIKTLKTLLFMGNQVTVADSEDALQIPIHKLENINMDLKFQQAKQKQWRSSEK